MRRAISVLPVPGGPYSNRPFGAALSARLNMRILSRMSDFTAGLRTIFSQIFVRSASETSLPCGSASFSSSSRVSLTSSGESLCATARCIARFTMSESALPLLRLRRLARKAATSSTSSAGSRGRSRMKRCSSSRRPASSGRGISILKVKRRLIASSICSGRFVAASTITGRSAFAAPSISVNI